MKYCEFCRKQLEDNEQCTCEEAKAVYQTKKASKKGSFFVYGGVALTVLLVIVLSFVLNGAKHDPFDYTNVSFEGYNSHGTAVVDFNKSDLLEEILGPDPIESESDLEFTAEYYLEYEAFSEAISYTCQPSEGLSNGDSVTVTFEVQDPAAKHIKKAQKTFSVSGLSEVETVDVFQNISVEFEGVSGKAKASVKVNSDDDYIKACEFTMSKNYDLSSKDTITVSIINADHLMETYEKVPVSTSKDYTVPELPSYLTQASQLPQDQLKAVAEAFIEYEQEDLADDSFFTYGEIKYYTTYFCMTKEDASFVKENNTLRIYICYDRYLYGEYRDTVYSIVKFNDLLINPDGSVALKFDPEGDFTFTTDMVQQLEALEEDYTVTEVKIDNLVSLEK